ncbi:peptidase [Acrocarpospora pleiomorpha]|uniref:Peptidase n=1 Tax=Acrocarpospora pleiomorpha TaxID=90975 RepID=A0A5M3XNI1_9ACTN|nr:membrane dipeptidase [Acrocarpospora pleiomorpha]GES22774.1 peptidase [Acrocarpospora pleiomorpha]
MTLADGLISPPPPIADAHNDLLIELAYRAGEPEPFRRLWLGQLQAGGVVAQLCPVSANWEYLPEGALRRALQQVVAFQRAVAENPAEVAAVRTREDLRRAADAGRIAMILSMEGAEPLGYSEELADIFWQLGVRVFGLTWNRRNPYAEGCNEPGGGGLSRLGRRLVARLRGPGAVIDLAHASERTFYDVVELYDGPLLVSHGNCRAVCDTPRNYDDAQLTALAERGGVVGIMATPGTVDPDKPTLERLLDHVDHAVQVMGPDHVALGADFFQQVSRSGAVRRSPDSMRPPEMGEDTAVAGFETPLDYPRLAEGLRDRGYADAELSGILRDNLLGFLGRALPSEVAADV